MDPINPDTALPENLLDLATMRVARNGRVVSYWPKEKGGEVLTKKYDSAHAVSIIFGRLRRDRSGRYLYNLIRTIRIEELKRAKPPKAVPVAAPAAGPEPAAS